MMKVKSFKKYLEKRLDKQEIAEIEKAARVEFEILSMLQNDVAKDVNKFMSDHNKVLRKFRVSSKVRLT